ncbi:Mediator of DNA damage checkpoint protein 1, partial [Galemys pyrenaicus]
TMEDTQVINWEVEEEEETEERSEPLGCNLEPLGRLRIFSSVHGPEKDFPLYLGKNVVGRMPDCSVTLPFPSISKQHAVIEIFAWDKAPVLQDCGSLNGTQILRPPKVLSPGMSHRLRNQELILFGDLPCQYYRRDVSLPFVSRGPLSVEETPRVQGGTQSRGLLLAEDSEEEVDPVAKRCVGKEPSATPSTLATVVPESDEEGPSSAQDGPGPPFTFNLDSDTDEEENQPPAARETSLTTETEQLKTEGGTTETQIGKNQHSVKDRDNDTEVERGARTGVVPGGVNVERSQPEGEDSDTDAEGESTSTRGPVEVRLEMTRPCNLIDSDTDVEEEGVPVTPAVVPMKKRQFFHGVSTKSPGAPGLAREQESPARSDTDVEEGEVPVTVLERSRTSIVIDSNTDDEEEVSAALTLACLKESHTVPWNQNSKVDEHMAQPAVLKQSQTSTGRDSDTDMEEEGVSVKKREIVPKGHTDEAQSEKKQPPLRDNNVEIEEGNSSPGVHLESSQASSTVAVNTQVEAKHQVHVTWTNKIDVEAEGSPTKLLVPHLEETQPPPAEDYETDAEEGTSLAFSATAGVRRSQLPAHGTAAILEQKRVLEKGIPGRSPEAQGKEDLPVSKENLTDLVVNTDPPGAPTQLQSEGSQTPTGKERELHANRTEDSGDNHDDSEDLDLQATQCFVEKENGSLEAVQSMEDEPTQAFLFSQPQEPGPSRCSFQIPGALDEPWEVLATQPYCPRESEASETQPIAAYLEAHGACDSSLQCQHPESPVHTQPLGIQGRGMQIVGVGSPRATAEWVTLEREPLVRETRYHPRRKERNCHLDRKMPPTEEAYRGDQESPDVCLPPAVPEASASFQSQKYPVPQPLLSPTPSSLEPPIPRTRRNESEVAPETPLSSELEPHHPEPKVKPQGSSRVTPTPVSSLALKPHLATPTDQPIRFEPPAWVSQVRTRRSSIKTPESVFPTEPQFQPFTSKDQSATPKPTSQTTRGRAHRSSVKTPEPAIPKDPKHQTSTSADQVITPEPTSRATGSRTNRSSLKTPEPAVPTDSELQTSTSKDQSATPKPTSQTTRGRAHRSSVKTPEPAVPTDPEPPPSTPTDQPVTPEPTSWATRGRAHRSSVKTPEPGVPTPSELQPSTPTDQPVTPEPTSRATRGRAHRSSVKTPEPGVPTPSELQPSIPTDQPVTPEPMSRATRGRAHRSVKTPKPVNPTTPEIQPSISKDQSVSPQTAQGRTHRPSVKTHQPTLPTSPDLEPPTTTDQPVSPKAIDQGQSRTRRSTVNAVSIPEVQSPVPTEQSIPPESIPQANGSRKLRATRKHGSLTVSHVPEPCPAPPEPNCHSSRNQRRGAVRAAESFRTTPEPASAQPPKTCTQLPQIQKVEEAVSSGLTLEPHPKASQRCKRPLATMDSPPLQKRLQRGEVPQKTAFIKKEEEDAAERPVKDEHVAIPGPVKRKRDQTEEPTGIPSRSLRRAKPNQESTAPKVLFTGVVDARGERAVLTLGGSLASSVTEASHLVTDRIRRTVKFLCALGRGIPILSLDWLHQSRKAGCFLPPDEYVVTDPEQEKNFGFSLREALRQAREQRLLEGYEIHVTPGVQPPPPQMGEIISCCGGTVLPSMPRSYKVQVPRRVVITCSQDFPRCSIPCRIGLPVVSPEFLLTGVLKQEAKPEDFILSTSEVSST